ncbi:MAG: hypothetical protein QXD24_00180 [Candidatus Caldarchaeum sp.]
MPTSIQVFVTPGLVTSSIINLLSMVVLAGVLAILFVRKGCRQLCPGFSRHLPHET